MDSFFLVSFLAVYALDIFLLFLFGIHTYIMVYLYKKNSSHCNSALDSTLPLTDKDDPRLPIVTVQLPVYNEFYVVDRLVDATVQLDYPKDKLQIQLLDDSTDESKNKGNDLVTYYQKQGFWIEHLHRTNRRGHKAGALEEGLEISQGEFVAIFDADFVPEKDFLLKTLPFFQEPQIGMVQTRWGHINPDYNILTKGQSFGIDGHFMIEQVARNGSQLWMNFNGTAGIWRKSTILDAGGWQHDTLTEDFDLSYRAELKGWKFRYFQDIVCKGEIPATMNAYKSQQFRWCKGSIQTAVKLLPTIWKAKLPLAVKAEAIVHLTNYSVHPLMVLNILLTAPLLLLPYWGNLAFDNLPLEILLGSAFLMTIGSLGPILFYAYSQKQIYPHWISRLRYLPFLMMMGIGIAIVNSRAWIEAVMGIPSGFKRTPKLKLENSSDKLQDRIKYRIPMDFHVFLEIGMAFYCLFCVALCFFTDRYYSLGFLLLYFAGFTFTAFQSIRESLWFLPSWASSQQESSLQGENA